MLMTISFAGGQLSAISKILIPYREKSNRLDAYHYSDLDVLHN